MSEANCVHRLVSLFFMTPYEQLRNARHDIWRNLPNGPTTFSRCECDRGNGRGGGPCIKCAEDALAKLVGEVEAAAYVATVRRVRDLERGHEMLLANTVRHERDQMTFAALRAEAEAAAAQWEPFTQNHCPSFRRALRDAWAQGYASGVAAQEKRHNDKSEGRRE